MEDLEIKRKENPEKTTELMRMIKEVYECRSPSEVAKEHPNLKFEKGLSVELVLKVLKWLFIEQDVTYWNYDGRTMLFSAIKEKIS